MKILIVDDQPEFRDSLRDLLATVDGVEVVGEAPDGKAAVDKVVELKPDLTLMDIRMPVMDGIAATRAILSREAGVRILVLTTFDEDELVRDAMRAGAHGYLLKGTPLEEMIAIFRLALRGYVAIGPRKSSNAGVADRFDRAAGTLASLSDREKQILGLIAQGLTNREIAKDLFLTEGTVRNYVSTILSTLGLRHRTEAALLWRASETFP